MYVRGLLKEQTSGRRAAQSLSQPITLAYSAPGKPTMCVYMTRSSIASRSNNKFTGVLSQGQCNYTHQEHTRQDDDDHHHLNKTRW